MTNKITGCDVEKIVNKIESTKNSQQSNQDLNDLISVDSINPNIKQWLDNYNCGIIDKDKMKEDCALARRLTNSLN